MKSRQTIDVQLFFGVARYGDKSPRTPLARVFAVMWMFSSTIGMSFFSAQITADLASSEINTVVNLIGEKVGLLKIIKQTNFI